MLQTTQWYVLIFVCMLPTVLFMNCNFENSCLKLNFGLKTSTIVFIIIVEVLKILDFVMIDFGLDFGLKCHIYGERLTQNIFDIF